MKLSVDWLREYIDFDCPVGKLAEDLTMAGLEVEESRALARQDFIKAGGEGLKDDTVWDVKVTPNRGDWLSMIGVARECGPLVGRAARMPAVEAEGTDPPSSELISISIDDPDLCRRYVGVVVRGVKIQESPGWLKDRLIASGMRPINNVVDVTNYVMMELGQPLHAFDYRLLHGAQIIVRRARPGETITSIDGVERELEPDMLVIADADRPVAIAGVMGGADSEIGEHTEDILIESANFDSTCIRRTAKRLNMVTESSYRFERSVDPSITALAAMRAAELIRDLGGGSIARGAVDVYPNPIGPLEVRVRPERVNAVLGTSIETGDMIRYLGSLEIEAREEGGVLACRVPTFRSDITREIDLVEEVGRVYGYDKLGLTLPARSFPGKDSREGAFRDRIRRILMSCGAQEVLTHSLVDSRLARLAGRFEERVEIRNPLSEELDTMRVALVPNLLQVLQRNQAFGTQDLSVFEVGKVYFKACDGTIGEKLSVGGAMVGNLWESAWALPEKALEVDFFLCKGVVEALVAELGIGGARFVESDHALLHPTRAAKLVVAGREVGVLGEASPEAREELDVNGRPCVFELDFGALLELAPEVRVYREVPRYPALYRHLAIVVSDEVRYDSLVRTVTEAGGAMVEQVDLLDEYRGEQIGANRRSLTLSVVFRSPEKTLTDEEVNEVLAKMKEAVSLEAGASFR